VPYHPNPSFTGRDRLLAEIHGRLTAPDADRQRVVLTGLGGMGKTQLAVEHAYRQRADYDLVWWVRSEQPTSLLGDYAALAGQAPLVADPRLAETAAELGHVGPAGLARQLVQPRDDGKAKQREGPQRPRRHPRPPAQSGDWGRRGHGHGRGCPQLTIGTAPSSIAEHMQLWPVSVPRTLRTTER
jgi:hypothetical protein